MRVRIRRVTSVFMIGEPFFSLHSYSEKESGVVDPDGVILVRGPYTGTGV